MHLRKLVLACGFASLALSNYASALGLGEVKLKSTLNQPLSAEIQLLDTRDLSADQILISLASPADFERNGVERLYFYTEFQFEVALDNPGGPVVRVTTRNPVREPYLNFLIEARWTAGRYMREYTVLMDLPTYDEAAPAAVQAPQAAPKANAPAAKVSPPAVDKPATSAPQSAAPEQKPDIIAEQDTTTKAAKTQASGTYGPVGKNDTLWEIALAVRPDSNVSVHQTMMALQRLNPDAFINGNINLIKKGQVLRVPDSSEINSVSKSEAVRQFNAQVGQSGAVADSSLGAQLDATGHASGGKRASEPASGRVKLQAPSAAGGAGGQGSGANKGSGRALENELASALEELDKAKSEKTELSSRVHDLEEQVKTMQRLVDVSNEKLRAMQLNAAKTDSAGKAAPAKDAATGTVVAEKASVQASVTAVASSAPSSVVATETASSAAPAVAPEAAKPAPKPKKVVVAPPPEPTLVDKLIEYAPWLGLGAAGLGVAGFVVARRRKAEAEAQANANREPLGFDEDEPSFAAFDEHQHEVATESAPVDEMSLFDEEDTTAVAETGDVVGEADIYIAYGKFDQAEEMLLNGLAKDPANTDIRLKLLEVYSQTQNLTEFDKHYAAILPAASAATRNRAAELRANIEGSGDFDSASIPASAVAAAGVAAGVATSSSLAADDFELDGLDDGEQSTALADDDFSFDLDLDDADVKPAAAHYDMDLSDAPVAEANAQLDDEFNLDFDLPNDQASEAEDLSDISLALDSLDEDTLPADLESSSDDEFSFDFNELDDDTSAVAKEVESINAPQLASDDDFNPDALGDDFNLEMDVDDLDLAALDHEMEALDKDLDVDDEELFAAESSPSAAKFDFDDELGDLDLKLDDDSLPEDLPVDDAFAGLDLDAPLATAGSSQFGSDNELSPDSATVSADDDLQFDEMTLDELALEESLPGDSDLSLDDEFESLDSELSGDEELSFEVSDDDLLAEEPEASASLDGLPEDLSLDSDEFDLESFDGSQSDSLKDLDAAFDELALDEDDSLDDEVPALNLADDVAPQLQDDPVVPEFSLDDDQDNAGLILDEDQPESQAVHVVDNLEASAFESGEDISDDDLFEQALSDFSSDQFTMDETSDMSDDEMDDELDFMADADEAATKLDLARAYIDMGDSEGARDILAEVAQEGNDQQRQEAADLLSRIDA